MLQKFVFWTGAMDFLIGLGSWGGAFYDPKPGLFVALITLGAFLMVAAALLMWASQSMLERAPVIYWQGLVRLSAVIAILYAVPTGLSQSWEYGVAVFDGLIGLVYIIGMVRVTGYSPLQLFFCKTQ